MPRTGRPRKPTRLKLIEGNRGRRPIDTTEPAPPVMIPSCPRHLKGEARKEWRRITKELLALNMIAKVDRAAIAAYCVQWARWITAEEKIATETSLVYKTGSGYPIQSPWLAVSNKALEIMHKYLTEFGLTAASRTRLKVEMPKAADPAADPAAAYFK